MVDHRCLIDAAPLLHRGVARFVRATEATIVVGQHSEASVDEMACEGAIELPRDSGAAVQQNGMAIRRSGLEEAGGKLDAVACGEEEIHAASPARSNDDGKRFGRRLS